MKSTPHCEERKKGERGNELIEFVFVIIVLVPLMMYMVILGVDLARFVEVTQVASDAGSMYSRGVDFSQSGNQQELARMGQTLGMAVPGTGSGAVLLSKITYIATNGCTQPCNAGDYVLVQMNDVGDGGSSPFFPSHSFYTLAGTPSYDSEGNVLNYMTDSNAVVSGVSTVLSLNSGEYAYVAEAYFPSTMINFPGFASNPGNYSRAIY